MQDPLHIGDRGDGLSIHGADIFAGLQSGAGGGRSGDDFADCDAAASVDFQADLIGQWVLPHQVRFPLSLLQCVEVFGIVNVVAMDAVGAGGFLCVLFRVAQTGQLQGTGGWFGVAAFLQQLVASGRPRCVHLQDSFHGGDQSIDGIEGIRAFGALSSVAGVDGTVGVEEHGGPVEVIIELELVEVDTFHFHLAHGNEAIAGEQFDFFAAVGDIGIEGGAVAAGHAAESDEQGFVGAASFGHGRRDVVVHPDIRLDAVGILQAFAECFIVGAAELRGEGEQENCWQAAGVNAGAVVRIAHEGGITSLGNRKLGEAGCWYLRGDMNRMVMFKTDRIVGCRCGDRKATRQQKKDLRVVGELSNCGGAGWG